MAVETRLERYAMMYFGPEEEAKLSDHGRYVRDAIENAYTVELVDA